MADSRLLDDLAGRILGLPPAPVRLRVAIAGPPAAGKSTLAAELVTRLNAGDEIASLVPMDGFHLDNLILQERGLLDRKGAPETFDGIGFLRMIERLGRDAEVVIPTFDRARDIAIAGAAVVGPQHRIAVVEGNYLCFDEPPWKGLLDLWDLSIFVPTPIDVLEARLVQRWIDHGLPPDAARERARGNDLRNAERVMGSSAPADIRIDG